MNKLALNKPCSLLILGLFCSLPSFAGSTPPLSIIKQETAQNMAPNTTQTLTYTIKNNVPTAPVMLNLSPQRSKLLPATTAITWRITDDCSYKGKPHYVPPSGTCNVNIALTAGKTTSHINERVYINYGPTYQTIAPAPGLNFDISTNAQAFFFTVEAAGNNMLVNSSQFLSWTVKNTTANAITISNSAINFTVPSALIAPPIFSNDCGGIVAAHGGTCNISSTIHARSTAGKVSQYLAVPYGAGKALIADKPTNFSILSTAKKRTLTFDNQCPYNVWIAFVGGGQLNGCKTDSDCDKKSNVVPGTFVCDPAADANKGICNWKNPVPANGNYKLAPHGATTVDLLESVYPLSSTQHLVWSGVIGGRTGCDSSSGVCTTGDCGGGQGACPTGSGLTQPALQAEPTFQQESDFYDITGINGINIPMSIEPLGVSIDADNPYTCGTTGSTSAQTASLGTIGACSWNFVPPSNAYIWVPNGGAACSTNSQCNTSAGQACGLSPASIAANSAQTTCGNFEGYWTADQVCGMNSNYSQAPYLCTNPATNGTFTNMYACTGTGYNQSCYNSSSSTTCCGCQNWQEIQDADGSFPIQLPSNPAVIPQCNISGNGSSNSVWLAHSLPTLTWYKAACPPFYVYPFDDKSSTFSCTNNPTGVNSTNYKVTYCPDGKTGAPSGVVPNP